MPFINPDTGENVGAFVPAGGPQLTDPKTLRPMGGMEALGAGFIEQNPVAQGLSFVSRQVDRPSFQPTPGFNPLIQGDLKGYEDVLPYFASAVSNEEIAYRKKQVDAIRLDTMRLDNSGQYAEFGRMFGAMLSPDQLVGAGELLSLARVGKVTVGGEMLRMAGMTLAVSGAENYAMTVGNPLRPDGSSMEDILSQTIANTFFGGVRGFTAPKAAQIRALGEQMHLVDPLPARTDGSFWSKTGMPQPTILGEVQVKPPKPNPYAPRPLMPEFATQIAAAETANGLPAGYLETTMRLESRGGQNVVNPKNPNVTGPFQLDANARALPGANDADKAAVLAKQNQAELTRQLGRAPTEQELYLAHQQGASGAATLIQNPDKYAIDALSEFYVKAGRTPEDARKIAHASILDNGGQLTDKSKDFVGRWQAKYDSMKMDNIGAGKVQTAGAAETPLGLGSTGGIKLSQAERMSNEALKSAYGLENIPINVVMRGLKSASETMRVAIGQLTDISGFQVKNFSGIASDIPVWGRYRLLRGDYGAALRGTDQLYADHLQRLATEAGVGGPTGILQNAKAHLMGTAYAPSKAEFFRQVGDAKSVLGTADEALHSAEAIKAAKLWDEKIYKPIAELGHENGAFVYGPKREMEGLNSRLKAAQASGSATKEEIAALKLKKVELQYAIDHAMDNSPYRPDYVNRIWRHEEVVGRRTELGDIIRRYNAHMTPEQISATIDRIAKQQPFVPIGPDQIGRASATHQRTLDMIPDSALKGFIERDISVTGGAYTRTMGVDAHLAKTFNGDIDLRDVLNKIGEEHDAVIAAAEGPKAKLAAQAAKENDLSDARALRDLVRGTYGLAADPHALTSRAIRLAKNWNVLTQLTGMVSALPDIARIPMTEGFNRAFGDAFKAFVTRSAAYKIGKAEAQIAGEAMDVATGMRAATMADITDSFATSSKVERLIQHATNGRFLIDGMSHWTDMVKTIASMTIGTRMIGDIKKLAAGTLDGLGKAKLARAYIDGPMAERMAKELETHALQDGHLWFANTEKWTDRAAAEHFSAGLGKDINIAVVTPSPGEKPLWMSTELGSMIGQYKGFGMGATMRIMLPGLQAPDRNFMLGLVALVGLGALTDMLQTNRRGQDYSKKPHGQKLVDAVDRSSALGYFMDVNNIVEGSTGFGMRTLAGGQTRGNAASSIGGPTVSSIMDAIGAATGNPADPRVQQMRRRLVPLGRVWQLDPIFDQIGGT